MPEMMTSVGIPEVALDGGIEASEVGLSPEFSGKWEDMGKDMAALAVEFGAKPDQPAQPEATQPPLAAVTAPAAPVAQPAQAAPQNAAPAQVAPTQDIEVPEKFRGPDGKLDQEKLLKSYGDAERALKRAQNQARQPAPAIQPEQQALPQVQPNSQAPAQLTPFELQVAQDIFSQGGFTEQQAVAMARVQVKLLEAKHQADSAATLSKVAQFEQVLEEQARQKELDSLSRAHPWVLTPKGQQELIRVREENPWVNTSPEPWRAATMILLGQKSLSGNAGGAQVLMPIPTGAQQAAPPLPVLPASRPQAAIPLNTPAEVEAYVKTLSKEQEAEFWKKAGFKWDTPAQFKGVL